ncbi:MAG: hypothetical protein LBV51_05105 [Acholeplasmatales bacterium]|jgi:hypothetical protein|nr:hypothetical protein [Acholeplasmatales bacterium]
MAKKRKSGINLLGLVSACVGVVSVLLYGLLKVGGSQAKLLGNWKDSDKFVSGFQFAFGNKETLNVTGYSSDPHWIGIVAIVLVALGIAAILIYALAKVKGAAYVAALVFVLAGVAMLLSVALSGEENNSIFRHVLGVGAIVGGILSIGAGALSCFVVVKK